MDDTTLDDVPDALVEAVLRKLPRFYEIVKSRVRAGKIKMEVREQPAGTFDVDIGTTLDHERVTFDG